MLSVLVCFLSAVLPLAAADSSYLATFPNALSPGLPLDIRVHVLKSTGDVSITAEIQLASNRTTVASTSGIVQQGVPKTVKLQVPFDLLHDSYIVAITGSGGAVFRNHSTIEYVRDNLLLYIQTDKVRYSAGQTVKYRIVSLLPNLKAYPGTVSVDIYDGKDNRIYYQDNIPSTNGVVNGSLQLSSEPVFGTWKISATAREQNLNKTFDVYSYVLPPFIVDVELPETVLTSDSQFSVRVTARYTFNTDVRGDCILQIYSDGYLLNALEDSKQIVGAVNFTVSMADVHNHIGQENTYIIRAIVTDNATLITMATEKTLTFKEPNTKTQYARVRFLDSRMSFVPGLPYETFIFIGQGDEPTGHPGNLTVSGTITTAEVRNCHEAPNYVYPWLDEQTVKISDTVIHYDSSGYALLTIASVPEYAETLELTFTGPVIGYDYFKLFSVLNGPSTTLFRVTPDVPVAKIGASVGFAVHFTQPITGNILIEAYCRGQQVEEKIVTVHASARVSFVLAISPDMVPEVYVLVSHTTTSGIIKADYVLLKVEGQPFNTQINVSYSITQLQPGQQVQVTLSGTPNSTVYMLVQDERNRLIGTDNDIFLYEVRENVLRFDMDPDQNLLAYPRQFGKMSVSRRESYTSNDRYDNVYRDCGVIYLTDGVLFYRTDIQDLDIFKTQLPNICPTPEPEPPLLTGQTPIAAPGLLATTVAPSPTGIAVKGTILRNRFPETWIWDSFKIGSSGYETVSLYVPDSVTSWITSAFIMNENTGFGIDAVKKKITVKRDFFITLYLPESIVLGEEFLLQVTAFNYMATSQMVFLQVEKSDDRTNAIPAAAKVDPGSGYSTFIPVTPVSIGTLRINVEAKAGSLFSVVATDALVKEVKVIPPGARITKNEQHLIHLSGQSPPFTKTIVLAQDPFIINGTQSTKVSLTGDFMIPSIDGLQSLIALPYGCGEQTMLNFAPDIYITKYLKTVGKLTEEVKRRSESVLNSGLQRELTYQHSDGSFSAFGDQDSSGSTWLTAFVVKCFQQARHLIKIDETISRKALIWMLNFQNQDGSFTEPGRVIHTQMQAGTSSGMKLTAFILASLLENQQILGTRGTLTIQKASHYLESRLNSVQDVYTLAIVCYALSKSRSSRAQSCLSMIQSAAIIDTESMHWEAHDSVVHGGRKRALPSRAPSADIEATSYILLTYLGAGKSDEAFPIVKWIVSQRNPQGGFQSTQDTVISLQALAEYSELHSSGGLATNINFNMIDFGSGFKHSYTVTSSNSDVVHETEVPEGAQNIMVQAMGSGSAVFDIVTSYHVMAMNTGATIDVTAPITYESLNEIRINPCISWKENKQSGQLLLEVEMPTGFVVDSEGLKQVSAVKKHEVNGKKLVLYFDGVQAHGSTCAHVKMTRADPVVKSQACHVIAYDYYNPTNQAMTRYESGILKRANICNVCPHCNFCSGNVGNIIVG